MALENVIFEAGYITLVYTNSRKVRHAVSDILRALDIPTGLTHEQVPSVTTLSNIDAVLIRTLIARGYLDDDFLEKGEYNLESITESIEEMGGNYEEPDISVPS